MKKVLTITMALGLLVVPSITSASIVIDNFEDPNSAASLLLQSGDTSAIDEDDPVTGVIGGARGAYLQVLSGQLGTGETGTVRINDPTFDGRLHLSATLPSTFDLYFNLGYGIAMPSGGPLNSNWSALDRIRLDFSTAPAENQFTTIELFWDYAGPGYGHDPHFFTIPSGASSMTVMLSNFTGIDLTDIDAITVRFDPIPDGQSLVLEEIVVVPEPATLALLALGGVALIRCKRK